MEDTRSTTEKYTDPVKEASRLAREVMPFIVGTGTQTPAGNIIIIRTPDGADDCTVSVNNDRSTIVVVRDDDFIQISLRQHELVTLSATSEEDKLKLIDWVVAVLQRIADDSQATMSYSAYHRWVNNEYYGLRSLINGVTIPYGDNICVIRPASADDNKIATIAVSKKDSIHELSLDIMIYGDNVLRINGIPFSITEYTFFKLVYLIQFIIDTYVYEKCNVLNEACAIVMAE